MNVNKVIFNGNTVMDISDTNFDESLLPLNSVAYNAAGDRIVGQAIVHNVYIDTTANWNEKISYIPTRGDNYL